MSEYLSDDELAELERAPSPIPTHPISNGEFSPGSRTAEQRQVAARMDRRSPYSLPA